MTSKNISRELQNAISEFTTNITRIVEADARNNVQKYMRGLVASIGNGIVDTKKPIKASKRSRPQPASRKSLASAEFSPTTREVYEYIAGTPNVGFETLKSAFMGRIDTYSLRGIVASLKSARWINSTRDIDGVARFTVAVTRR